MSKPLAESRCVQDERCGVIWPKSMPCTGGQTPGTSTLFSKHGFLAETIFQLSNVVPALVFRLLVSASQDGKLIIWDSYTTNKVNFI